MSGIPQDSRSPFRQQRWVECRNDSGADLDPFSLVAVTGATRDSSTGQTILVVEAPTETTPVALLAAMAPQTCKSGYEGHCTLDFPAYVLFDDADTPANGEMWGPETGNARIVKNRPGLRICGDEDGNIVRVAKDNAPALTRFELNADLDRAGTASAKLLDINWDDTGETITVRDPFTVPGCWQAFSGYKGFAVIGENDIYDVVWMERRALVIYFTLTQDTNMASGTTATITSYFQQGDKNPGGTGLVYDHQELYPKAKNGAKGIAVWNDDRKRYEVVVCQQLSTLYWGQATSAFCPDDDEVPLNTVNGYKLHPYQHSPFNQRPDPEPTVLNSYNLAGLAGDYVVIAYDAAEDEWDIVQVEPHAIKTYCEWRIHCDPDPNVLPKLQAKYRTFYAYICSEDECCEDTEQVPCDWDDVGEIGTRVTNVTSVYWDGLCLTQDQQVQYVLCEYDPTNSNIDCPVECDEAAATPNPPPTPPANMNAHWEEEGGAPQGRGGMGPLL